MKIAFAATNPCHIYPLAKAVAREDAETVFYTGYPGWKLGDPGNVRIHSHSLRTLAVYTLMRLPPKLRPAEHRLFEWQDAHFDRWAASVLEPADFVHGVPGQCVNLFKKAAQLNIQTILNHATGPVEDFLEIMEPEYKRHGLRMMDYVPYTQSYIERIGQEREMACYHAVASTVVRDQLVRRGVSSKKIWIVPYGADETVFHSRAVRESVSGEFNIVFAGQLALRKGVRVLLEAYALARKPGWRLDLYGPKTREMDKVWFSYEVSATTQLRGVVGAAELAQVFRRASVLVLPSLEEGFGLVVPQALSCGLPCIVSDRVGAKDLIQHRVNGSIVPVGDAKTLAAEMEWWSQNSTRVPRPPGWAEAARCLLRASASAKGQLL